MRGLKAWWARRVSRADDPAWRLYRTVARNATRPAEFERFGLEDTPENRFELLALHMAAAWRRLNAAGPDAKRLRQGMGNAFVADMDASLRDLGAGDLGVGKRVKALTERLYGRLAAYAPALADGAEDALIRETLARNLYKQGGAPTPAAIDAARAVAALWHEADEALLATGQGPDIVKEPISND